MTTYPGLGIEYRIQQESNARYLDAHLGKHDDSAVTRGFQSNDTQVWTFERKGTVYTFQQAHNNRYLDAWPVHTSGGDVVDYRAVTRTAQADNSQDWFELSSEIVAKDGPVVGGPPAILRRLRQLTTRRYLDSYQSEADDYAAVTRPDQADNPQQEDTQLWEMNFVGNSGDDTYSLRQRSSGRYLDACTGGTHAAVVRPYQLQDPNQTLTQRWIRTSVGGLYAIRRKANGVYLDAYTGGKRNAVVRPVHSEDDDTQIWFLRDAGDDTVTIQQLRTLNYLDAYQTDGDDFSVVTRGEQGNDTQRWRLTEA